MKEKEQTFKTNCWVCNAEIERLARFKDQPFFYCSKKCVRESIGAGKYKVPQYKDIMRYLIFDMGMLRLFDEHQLEAAKFHGFIDENNQIIKG